MSVATSLRKNAVVGLALLGVIVAGPVRAQDPTTMGDAMIGVGSGVAGLIYTPLKILYAVGGLGVGSLVYLFSAGNKDAMGQVLATSAGGDYTVTPDHLRGTRVLKVTGGVAPRR